MLEHLGMLHAQPEFRWPFFVLDVDSVLVFWATIHGRRHYAGDDLASSR